jgi:hypothetical protein
MSLSIRGVAEDEIADSGGGRVEYNGTANAKIEFRFGRTNFIGRKISDDRHST